MRTVIDKVLTALLCDAADIRCVLEEIAGELGGAATRDTARPKAA